MGRSTVLYDADCGFCRWSADKLRAWDVRRNITFQPIQSATGEELLRDVPADRRLASWHLADDRGTLSSAEEAVPEVLRLLPFGGPLATMTGRFPGVTGQAYRWVARHRGRLGRLVGERACSVDPSRP
jgi:predicted DCC family thiol-disulfide oxidoreductase YuxK